ncbi:MAG: metallophosphoesterase [Lentisphaeria bacterium]|nr:metallophosphoesterase [Lentisphaeria bacterium]
MNRMEDPSCWKWSCFIVESGMDAGSFFPLKENSPEKKDDLCKNPVSFPEDGILNLYSLKGVLPQPGKKILLAGEFDAEQASSCFIGMAGEGKFLLHFNSRIILDGRQWGNNEFPLQHNSHILELDLLPGRNQLIYEVSASGTSARFFLKIMENMQSLSFRYGPYLTFPDSSEKAISIVFSSNRPSPAAVDYCKEGETTFHRIYDNLGGQRRRDKAVHSIRLSELESGCVYRYRCVLQDDCRNLEELYTPENTFRVPSEQEKEFSFVFTADLQNVGGRSEYLQALLGKDPGAGADFFVFGGDLFWTSNFDRSVAEEFLEEYRSITNGTLPLVMVRGNHEIYGKESNRYFEYFTPPCEGREGYYMFRRGKVCFIVLDFCDDDGWMPPSSTRQFHDFEPYLKAQRKWLEKAVKLPMCQEAEYRIVLAHGVPLGDPHKYMPTHVREGICGIFSGKDPQVRIHLWLGGHVHRPFRSIPGSNSCYSVMDPAEFSGAPHDPVGADYDFPVVITGGPNGKAGANMQNTSIHVEVTGKGLTVRSLDRNQKEFDALTVAPDGTVLDLNRDETQFGFYRY